MFRQSNQQAPEAPTARNRLSKFCSALPWSKLRTLALILTIFVLFALCLLLEFRGYRSTFYIAKHDAVYHLDLVQRINAANSTWRAVYNRFASKTNDSLVRDTMNAEDTVLLRTAVRKAFTNQTIQASLRHKWALEEQEIEIPRHFDARLQWPHCSSIHQVLNQGSVGSCWAIAAATSMADRICIHSKNGTLQPRISVDDIMSCCHLCRALSLNTYNYWRDEGVVTGGSYGSNEGCRPYSFHSDCGTPCPTAYYIHTKIPSCERKCQKNYRKSYFQDKLFASESYFLSIQNVYSMWNPFQAELDEFLSLPSEDRILLAQKEILLNGPIEFCFDVMEDFLHYHSGVYSHVTGGYLYGHCVRIIGWGETASGVPYWIAVNSFGRDWGLYGIVLLHREVTSQDLFGGIPAV